MKVIVTCGGTGGHVFPGMMTAQALARRGAEVAVLLTDRGIERSATEWTGTTLHIRCPKPRWKHPIGFFQSIFGLMGALWQSVKIMRSYQPDVVLAMGSYTSFGPVVAARLCRIPVVLHDANVIPGSAVSILSRFARTVAVSFEKTRDYLPSEPSLRDGKGFFSSLLPKNASIVLTGLPIRTHIAEAPPLLEKKSEKTTLLVMGGSQGAKTLNERILDVFRRMPSEERRTWRVIHLCGHAGVLAMRAAYETLCADGALEVHLYGFLSEMGKAYASADLCISRAGAGSCFELALCGVPAILIPLPTALRDHQSANARAFEVAGAALCLPQSEATAERLTALLQDLQRDTPRRAAMKTALRALAQPDAADRLADTVLASATINLQFVIHPRFIDH